MQVFFLIVQGMCRFKSSFKQAVAIALNVQVITPYRIRYVNVHAHIHGVMPPSMQVAMPIINLACWRHVFRLRRSQRNTGADIRVFYSGSTSQEWPRKHHFSFQGQVFNPDPFVQEIMAINACMEPSLHGLRTRDQVLADAGDPVPASLLSQVQDHDWCCISLLKEQLGTSASCYHPTSKPCQTRPCASEPWTNLLSVCCVVAQWRDSWPLNTLQGNVRLSDALAMLLRWILEVQQSPLSEAISQAFSQSKKTWRAQVIIIMQVPRLCLNYQPRLPFPQRDSTNIVSPPDLLSMLFCLTIKFIEIDMRVWLSWDSLACLNYQACTDGLCKPGLIIWRTAAGTPAKLLKLLHSCGLKKFPRAWLVKQQEAPMPQTVLPSFQSLQQDTRHGASVRAESSTQQTHSQQS